MGLFDFLKMKNERVTVSPEYKMITTSRSGFYSFDGRLFRSDLIRSAIRPAVSSVGKLTAKHLRKTEEGTTLYPWFFMKMLLEDPNPYMSGQDFQEKMATELLLNGNAFALIVRDANGLPSQLYPIHSESVKVNTEKGLAIDFRLHGGKVLTVNYGDLIHLKQDCSDSMILGNSPAPAISNLMQIAGIVDQSLVNAVKNSGAIRWLLKFLTPLSPKDLKQNVKEFTENYLTYNTDTIGAVGVDSKADAIQVQPNDYVPNAEIQNIVFNRVKNFFSVNDDIIQAKATEEQWNAYFEQVIEPIALKLSNEMTRKLLTRGQRSAGNKIVFEAVNLEHVGMDKRINLGVQMVDRGALSVNEWRAIMNMSDLGEEGDVYIRRLDTAPISEEGEKGK